MITSKKREQINKWMNLLGITEEDLFEKFILGSGSGGQKINKTSSCVWLKHLPSGITVKCQQERSREMNRYLARQRLCEKLEFLIQKEKSQQQQVIEKVRRQKKRRTRRAKQKMLDDKKHRARRKQTRKKPDA